MIKKKKTNKIGKKYGPPPKKGPSSQGVELKDRVMKLQGGGMDMGNAANQAQSASMGNSGSTSGGNTPSGGGGGRDLDYQQRGMSKSDYSKSKQTQNFSGNKSTAKAPPSTTKSTLNIPPVTPVGLTIAGLKAIENARRAKRAKGEFFFSSKKTLPATRDFYKVEGRKLQTQIGSPDEDYLKATGITGGDAPPPPKGGDGPVLCPDGSMPPCVDTTKAKPVTPGGKNPVTPYKFNFEYRDGGLVRGSGKVLKGRVKKARVY